MPLPTIPRMKMHRLLFFALETTLLTTAALATVAGLLHRRVYDPLIGFSLIALSLGSFMGLPVWCAVYHRREPQLSRVAAFTLVGMILWFFLSDLLPK